MAVVGSGEHPDARRPEDAEQQDQRSVVVQVKASAPDLPPLRLVAADLAARADFDLDTVADLRLAVDEAASELVTVATPEAILTCVFSLDAGQMEVSSSVQARPGAILRQDSFGWRVLTTLVDEVRVTGDPGADPPVLGISLCKRRSVKTPAEGH
ncbi:MAG: ATP-binding protein [Pseudonocardiaceae bacterium]